MIRNYTLTGQSPPYYITITKSTQFFRAAPVTITEALIQEGEALLNPHSAISPLAVCGDTVNFITVEGEVTEVSAVKKVSKGREAMPLKNITLQENTTQVVLCLWREAAVQDVRLGSHVKVSHLKSRKSSYGLQLHSTTFTMFEEIKTSTDEMAEVVGVMETNTPGILQLLMANNEVCQIEAEKWWPFDAQLDKGPVHVHVCKEGKQIVSLHHV
ncbi:uncharacterized protein LOC114868404 [Betta splendens]|uniref:Uncharacterized protein LOC114868404 n=1 Tax=Betta splendens TaxID=158456 RepID=A0A6P7P5N8_BETSP|nr:uncharacterized protein LOC114868404 [Betta splendens]